MLSELILETIETRYMFLNTKSAELNNYYTELCQEFEKLNNVKPTKFTHIHVNLYDSELTFLLNYLKTKCYLVKVYKKREYLKIETEYKDIKIIDEIRTKKEFLKFKSDMVQRLGEICL